MNRKAIYAMLAAIPDANVFPDFVPENETLPAMTYEHISNVRTRIKHGHVGGYSDIWRVTIYGYKRADIDVFIEQLKIFDNTDNADFQRVFITNIHDEIQTQQSVILRSFVDLQTFD